MATWEDIETFSTVYLKSGGEPMVVSRTEIDKWHRWVALCEWHDDVGTPHEKWYPFDALTTDPD
jgi:uncharacterized protein YodC (DUF2158 family)